MQLTEVENPPNYSMKVTISYMQGASNDVELIRVQQILTLMIN